MSKTKSKKSSRTLATTDRHPNAAAHSLAPVPPADRTLKLGTWAYAPAPETTPVKIDSSYNLFIDGQFTAPASGKSFVTINPATEKKLADVALANSEDVDRAVSAARRAQTKVWGKMPGRERAKYLYRIARLIQEKSRELAVLESMDGGKTIKESRDVDLPLVAAHFFYYAGWADKLDYAFPGRTASPLGVAGQVIPWNFPLLMAAWKLAPALATGNTCVLKPAETTSLTALHLARILQEAELPDGVVNIVTGAGETGAALVNHSDVNKVAFTGSTDVGKKIAASLAGTGKKLTLELGGKAANIVFADAPIEQAVEGIVAGIYFNQGHVCCAGSRLLVQESIHDEVIRRLRDRISTLRVGDPLDKNTDIGAINSKAAAGQNSRTRRLRRLRRRGPRSAEMLPAQDRLLLPAKLLHRRYGGSPHRPRGDLWPGPQRDDLPHSGGSHRTRQQYALRTQCRRLDRQGVEDFQNRCQAPCGYRLGEHVQQVRPD